MRIPSPEEIVAHLSEAIKGHESTKRMLASATYAHLVKASAPLRSIRTMPVLENCLISGPTGSGKSAMLQRLAEFVGMPVVTVLAGAISPSGYKGKNCSDVLDQIEARAVVDGCTTPTLVVWDEIDKICTNALDPSRADTESGVYKRMTQTDMLGILQGVKMSDRPGLDLSQLLHIGCGAFVEKAAPVSQRSIGFISTATTQKVVKTKTEIGPDYFISKGLIAELVGRFPRLSMMMKPDRETIREIITESSTSSLRHKIWHFAQHDSELTFDEGALDLIAEKVAEHPTGVRALQLVLNQLLDHYEYEITRTDKKSIESIRFSRAAVAGTEEPMIIRASTNNSPIKGSIPLPKRDPDDDWETISVF